MRWIGLNRRWSWCVPCCKSNAINFVAACAISTALLGDFLSENHYFLLNFCLGDGFLGTDTGLKTLAAQPSREGPSGSTERLASCPPSAVFVLLLSGDFCTQTPPFTYAIRSVLPDGHGGSRCRWRNTGSGVRRVEYSLQ